MARTDVSSIFSAAVIWCMAYVIVAVISSLRAFTLFCFCVSSW
ncbi:Plasma membrane ATPase [Bienertia sinuspersici]